MKALCPRHPDATDDIFETIYGDRIRLFGIVEKNKYHDKFYCVINVKDGRQSLILKNQIKNPENLPF